MLLLLILFSCSQFSIDYFNKNYRLVDRNGEYIFNREGKSTNNEFYLKNKLSGQGKDYEKTLLITDQNFYPKLSEYTVFLDGEKETTKIEVKQNKLKLNSGSEELEIELPKNSCFYSLVPEAFRKFMVSSIRKGGGSISFKMIWEGYPFFKEIYLDMDEEVMVDAKLTFSGEVEDLYRFTLETPSQTIFYMMDKDGMFVKQLWVSQGVVVESDF